MFVWAGDVIKQPLCINPRNGGFTGGVNGQQKKPVRQPQNPGKFRPKIPCARVQMRLKHKGDFTFGPTLADGAEQRLELCWMMRVVVDVHGCGMVQMHFHSPAHTAKS